MPAAAVVLAAGRGARLGGEIAKPLLEYRERPLVSWALAAALDSGLAPVVLVVGHGADRVRMVAPSDVMVVDSPRWHVGISASLRAALDALAATDVAGACVGLADQPRVGGEAYRRIAEAGIGTGGSDDVSPAPVAVAIYHGVRGNPVWLARTVWDEARALTGDQGARQLMDGREIEVYCTGTGDPADVDTLDDLHVLEENS